MATTFIGPDGYEYSATTPGQDPRSRSPQSTNPFASTLSLLGAMQRQNAANRYASDAYRATKAAEASLFPMRKDPAKTARIDERRREMNVTEQRGRTQGQRRRDAAYREQTRARNAANATARTERAEERARDREETRAAVQNIIDRGVQRDPAYEDYLSEMESNEAASREFQSQAAKDRYQKLIDDTLASLPQDDAIGLNEADIARVSAEAGIKPQMYLDNPMRDDGTRSTLARLNPLYWTWAMGEERRAAAAREAQDQALRDTYTGSPYATGRDPGIQPPPQGEEPYTGPLAVDLMDYNGGGPYSSDLPPAPTPIPSQAYETSPYDGPTGSPYATGPDPTPYYAPETNGIPFVEGRTPEQKRQLQIDLANAQAMARVNARDNARVAAQLRQQMDQYGQAMTVAERGARETIPGDDLYNPITAFHSRQGMSPSDAAYASMQARRVPVSQPPRLLEAPPTPIPYADRRRSNYFYGQVDRNNPLVAFPPMTVGGQSQFSMYGPPYR